MDATKIELKRLLDLHTLPAILLHRPQSISSQAGLSKVGGLPNLPPGLKWPRGMTEDGRLPLHFLLQVDCSDLPSNDYLPDTGVLFFFARVDEVMQWDDMKAQDAARVLYAPVAPENPCTPPNDLPNADGGDGPQIFNTWPLLARPMNSWPSTTPEIKRNLLAEVDRWRTSRKGPAPNSGDAWAVANALRAAEIERVTGLQGIHHLDVKSREKFPFASPEVILEDSGVRDINVFQMLGHPPHYQDMDTSDLEASGYVSLLRVCWFGDMLDGMEAFFAIRRSDLTRRRFDRVLVSCNH